MANNTIITKKGMELLSTTSVSGVPKYWIGYYGLAYVPDRSSGSGDELKADMQQLTKNGDYIYNVWQGGMTDSGFAEGDTSAAANLYGMSLYSGDIMSRYRYILDKDNNNNLVMWRSSTNGTSLVGAAVYQGVGAIQDEGTEITTVTKSEMPVPAPLFYLGEPVEYSNAPSAAAVSGQINAYGANTMYTSNGAAEHYPTHEFEEDGFVYDIPAVSTDGRNYSASSAAMSKVPTESMPAGKTSLDFRNGASSIKTGNRYEWASASSTYREDGDAPGNERIMEDWNRYCLEYWKLQSISNYNRFHAPASSEGLALDYEPACRNMSKVTKYFPISHYNITKAKEGTLWYDDSAWNESASNIEFTLDVSLQRMRDYSNSIVNRTVEHPDKTQDHDDPYYSNIQDIEGKDLYFSDETSFKFNRVGIYAVPMTINRFGTEDDSARCDETKVQFEVNGNAEPVLFAVIDYSDDIVLRSTGSANKWRIKFSLNMENMADASQVITDAGIFYSMYEDDSVTWFKNQLIATASTSEAVTSLELQMNYLSQMVHDSINGTGGGGSGACGGTATKYAPLNHTHQYMKNLVDGVDAASYSVRGLATRDTDSKSIIFAYGTFNPDDPMRRRLSEFAVPGNMDDGDTETRYMFKRYRLPETHNTSLYGISSGDREEYLENLTTNLDEDY